MELYRLTRQRFAGIDPFDGEGSFLFGGRWSSVGTRLCYTSMHRSLAILEYRVNMDPASLPNDLVMATIVVPDGTDTLELPPLPGDWQEYPGPVSLRIFGDNFIRNGQASLMRVPSVIVPEEYNVLLNPAHPVAMAAQKKPNLQPFRYDCRML